MTKNVAAPLDWIVANLIAIPTLTSMTNSRGTNHNPTDHTANTMKKPPLTPEESIDMPPASLRRDVNANDDKAAIPLAERMSITRAADVAIPMYMMSTMPT